MVRGTKDKQQSVPSGNTLVDDKDVINQDVTGAEGLEFSALLESASIEDGATPCGEFMFASVAEWPDEEKPKVEKQYRRRRPLTGAWVLLGNDETWVIPEVAALGMDIEVFPQRDFLGRLSLRFSATYKHYKQLRELLLGVMNCQEDDNLVVPWTDAYMLMYLALNVNYKIPAKEINRLGLLRQEHLQDILAVLIGAVKKNEPAVEYNSPLPVRAGLKPSP